MIRVLFLLFIVGCGSKIEVTDPPMIEIFPEFISRKNGYGIIEQINDNSWSYKTHLIDYPECERSLVHFCKKVDTWHQSTPFQSERTTKYEFDLTVNKWNFDDPAFHFIIFQDWVKIDRREINGNHPITTLDLKPTLGGGLALAHHSNDWQWPFDLDAPYHPDDPTDALHMHPYKTHQGHKLINVDMVYHIELFISDGLDPQDGNVSLIVDGEVITDIPYQTKSPTETHWVTVGMYSYRDYNPRVNGCVFATGLPEKECRSNQITIANYRIYEL